jgi:rRNA processing protein Krr1/Pno1
MAAVVLVEMVHLEMHRMEALLAITHLLHRALQETALQIQVAVDLEQQMVTVVLVVLV